MKVFELRNNNIDQKLEVQSLRELKTYVEM